MKTFAHQGNILLGIFVPGSLRWITVGMNLICLHPPNRNPHISTDSDCLISSLNSLDVAISVGQPVIRRGSAIPFISSAFTLSSTFYGTPSYQSPTDVYPPNVIDSPLPRQNASSD